MNRESRRGFLGHAAAAALAPAAALLPDITPMQRRRSAVFPDGVGAGMSTAGAVLTTRITPSGVGAASVTWTVAHDRGMRDVVTGGRTSSRAEDDWLVRVTVPGLSAGVAYWFQFRVLGVTSTVGRIVMEASDAPA